MLTLERIREDGRGEVRILRRASGRVRVLMLYEESQVAVPVSRPKLRGRVVGSMHAIRCTVCGRNRDWITEKETWQQAANRTQGRIGGRGRGSPSASLLPAAEKQART